MGTVLSFVAIILKEAYSPTQFAKKFIPVLKIRIFKMLGMVFNQLIGKFLCGWNGKENRLYDNAGKLTDELYYSLYGTELTQTGVTLFVQRRLYYSFITSVCTIIQIICTAVNAVEIAIGLSVLLSPVTMMDRQWATSVTKSPPRYQREVFRHYLVEPLCQAYDIKPMPKYRLHRNPIVNVTTAEMLVGFVQFWTGLLLFLVPIAHVVDPQGTSQMIEGYTVLSTTVFLNILRVTKEVTNALSPSMEYYLTPKKYTANAQYLDSFLQRFEFSRQEDGIIINPEAFGRFQTLMSKLYVSNGRKWPHFLTIHVKGCDIPPGGLRSGETESVGRQDRNLKEEETVAGGVHCEMEMDERLQRIFKLVEQDLSVS
eukprot:PhF_6_TR39649/c1_g1_i2/m.58816